MLDCRTMWPISIGLSRVPHRLVLQVIAAFIPGFLLVVGGLAARRDLAAEFFSSQTIGYYSKIALILITACIAGWILYLIVLGGPNYLLGQLWIRTRPPVNEHSTNSEWRKVARKFIGEDLAPTDDSKWADWYLALQNYFLRSEGGITYELLTALQTSGWAGLILLIVGRLNHAFLWFIFLLAIIVGASWPWWTTPVPAGPHLIALILRELKKESRNQHP